MASIPVLPEEHKHLLGCVFFCLLTVFIYDVEPSPLPNGNVYSGESFTGETYVNMALKTREGANSREEVMYSNMEDKPGSLKSEYGYLNYQNLKGGHKVLTGGVEANICLVNPTWEKCLTSPGGAIARMNVAEKTVHLGRVDLNVGMKGDTGVAFNKGVEVKVVGIGLKIGADGFNVCVFFCVGFSW